MTYNFWNNYEFIPYDLVLKFDVRLQNVIRKLESFFKNVKIESYKEDKIEFFLAGSCIKADIFRDIDIFLPTKESLENLTNNFNKDFFSYKNNSNTYRYENDIIQIVYRERFLNKDLKFMVDIFDFFSTKIAFKCQLNTKTFKIKVLEAEIREEFIIYLTTKKNRLTRVNTNPFVSLQRAIHFLKRGDDVPFSVFLDICFMLNQIDSSENIEKYFERIQGDEQRVNEVKEAIESFLLKKRETK